MKMTLLLSSIDKDQNREKNNDLDQGQDQRNNRNYRQNIQFKKIKIR